MTARSNRKTPTKPATTAEKTRASANTTKPPTKRARLIGMLKTGGGADVFPPAPEPHEQDLKSEKMLAGQRWPAANAPWRASA